MCDWEYTEKSCPKCSNPLARQDCPALGCEEGYYVDEDGINGDTLERCNDCNGRGYQVWCRACGWDDAEKCFLSPQYEAEWLAKQSPQTSPTDT